LPEYSVYTSISYTGYRGKPKAHQKTSELFRTQKINRGTLRDVTDSFPTDELNKIFDDFLSHVQRGKHLADYQLMDGKYLISIDGSGVSAKISGIVIVDKGNIRSESSTKSMIIDQLKLDTTVTILEENEDWYKVEVSGNRSGWMHTSLVSKSSPGQSAEAVLSEKKIKHSIVLKVPIARVRKSPNAEAPVKFRLYRNDRVMVIDVQNDCKLIALDDGRTGWVHQSLFYPLDRTTPSSIEDTPSSVLVVDTRQIHNMQIKVISETEEWVLFMLNGFFTPEISVIAGENPKVICDFSGISLGDEIQHPLEVKGKLI